MSIIFNKNFSKNLSRIVLMIFFVFCSIFFTACKENYENMSITLSNNGGEVILFINEGVSTTQSVVATVNANANIDKRILVSAESNMILITPPEFDGENNSTITLTAIGVCKNVPVNITSVEGGKTAVFYVSVIIPLNLLSETTTLDNLYVVKGEPKNLNVEELVTFSPTNTTQKEITFSLQNQIANVTLENNVLTVGENFSSSTITLVATSKSNETQKANITLNVLAPINADMLNFSARYPNHTQTVNLQTQIELTKTFQNKNSVELTVVVNSIEDIVINPFINSTLTLASNIASVSTYTETKNPINTTFVFSINAQNTNGTDAIFFEISYKNYNYVYQTQKFNIYNFDAVASLRYLVDGVVPESYYFTVYDKYTGTYGMEILTEALPNTVPISECGLTLTLLTGASDYIYYNQSGQVIVFQNNKYTFLSGSKIYVVAKTQNSANAQFTISSNSNTELSRLFNISAEAGETAIQFNNSVTVGTNPNYYYLTTNTSMEQKIGFNVASNNIENITITSSGSGFTVNNTIYPDVNFGSYYFYINSVMGSTNQTGTLTIRAGNGLTATARVETFVELVQNLVSFSVPNSQANSAVGQVNILSATQLNSTTFDTKFAVAVKIGNNITLTKNVKGSTSINYSYYDFLLGEGSAYDEDYINFNQFSNAMTQVANYKDYSNVIRPIYLTSFSQIYAGQIGKVWVKVEINGSRLEGGVKTATTFAYYFLVECYQPIQNLTLSNTTINLYAKNSVGDDNYDLTSKNIDVYLNNNVTYNQIVWSNVYGLNYTLNSQKVYEFTNNINSIKIEAFSTLAPYEMNGVTHFANKNSLTFYFVAKIFEFNKVYSVSLKVNILKAQQVENIFVQNVNVQNGIYIELDYSGQQITYQILAQAQKGESGIKPYNNALVYSFQQNGSTSSTILSINSASGLITLTNNANAVGGTGFVRIAPADRYVNGQYVAGETDIAVYIPVTIADGRSRESSFRISSLQEIDNLNLHYTLMISDIITSEDTYAIFENFGGGLYGCLIGQSNFATITTNKTLFGTLSNTAQIKDLIIVGTITNSGNGFVADTNNGVVSNVTIETLINESQYYASSLTVSNANAVGGIVGTNNGEIAFCNFYGKITSTNSIVGGLVGINEGNINNCKVEMYNFLNEDNITFATINGGEFVGGLVGEMSNGTLTNSYAYSYAYSGSETKNYMGLNILGGTNVGGLVGNLLGGSINICFANINDITTLTGNSFTSGEIINAYIIYKTSNEATNANYTVNKIANYNYNTLPINSTWGKDINKNSGYPYFKAILQADSIASMPDTLATNLENIISKTNTSIIYFYASNLTLTSQEIIALNKLNTILFGDLLGGNANGVKALTSNKNILDVYANGITIKNTGFATLTLFSKYDFSIIKTFTIYVIYPISNLTLVYENSQFANGASINVKISDGFALNGQTKNSLLLVNKDILIKTNQLNLDLSSNNENDYSAFILGSGLGAYNFNTQALYDLENNSQIAIKYSISLISNTFDSGKLTDINSMLKTKFDSRFTINLYKGADQITTSTSNAQIEPSDVYTFETYIFSDLPYLQNNSEEDVIVSIDTKNYNTDLFTINVNYIGTIYYTNKTDLTQTTDNASLAVYFQHIFSISIMVTENYKHFDFDGESFTVSLIAKSSQTNSINYNSSVIEKNFDLTINSQSIVSVNATHFALLPNGKTLISQNQKNYVYYEYSTQSNSVLTPGDEGLLAVNIYPVFANYDYLTITYTTTTGESANLRLGVMNKESNGKFTKSNIGFETLENGIKIYNLYSYIISQINQNTLYLSTFIPTEIEKDTVFIITIRAYNEDNELVYQGVNFNLVVQYLEGAEISISDSDGKKISTVARGTEEYLVITIQKDQTVDLENISIDGRLYDGDVNNYITYSGFSIKEEEFSTTRTYTASLYIGSSLKLEDNANYITVGVTVSWIINGKYQSKTTYINVGVVDFLIDEVKLLTDKPNKTNLTAYIGIQTPLLFDFYSANNTNQNASLEMFLANYYYENLSGVNTFGDYVVNRGNENIGSFMANLYYVNGNNYSQILGGNGNIQSNSYFNFSVEEDGTIKITGKRSGSVALLLRIEVKLPSATQNVYKYVDFLFSITVGIYSDEDTPLIIDNETAFYDAINGEVRQNYILMTDINLTNYSPVSTNGIASLDGNNYTINILSWNTETTEAELKLALFDTVNDNTTLKNLCVNVYHSSNIVINTTKHTTINVAGIAITNNGVIYNCSVVAYKTNNSLPNLAVSAGFSLSYSVGQISETITSKLAGFAITNNGNITNCRVGGYSVDYVNKSNVNLGSFNLTGQGNICGFVFENSGVIASSYFANATIKNNSTSGLTTYSTGFVGNNNGDINLSYSKGVGENSFSLSGGGISTSSISAGFAYTNGGSISDCYSNIMLATTNLATQNLYASGRLTSGFAYKNDGTIDRCFTASKIEDAKTTQMNFVGVDNFGEMQNTGKITNSYYYNLNSDLDNAYANTNSNISVKRISEPDLIDNYYGFTFADSASSINGVWFITAYGIDLVSANQIAISNRYVANEVRDLITNELTSYTLPYTSGYEYGSKKNPIIIRNASEFNRVFGGDNNNAGTAIASYYNLDNQTVFGNYRIVTNINLGELIADETNNIKIKSSDMSLIGGTIDGNSFEISGLELVARAESAVKNYGLFATVKNNSIIMNLNIQVIAVNAATVQNVGAIAGTLENSKLINLSLYSKNVDETATIIGNNIVGGVVGKILGESEVKNISINNINVTANHISTSTSQYFVRDQSISSLSNTNISYAGGIAGVVDIYEKSQITNFVHNEDMSKPHLAFLKVSGSMSINGSTVGGVLGYMGPRTYLKDATLELSSKLDQKLIAYNCYAGGIVGENYGDLNMLKAEHEQTVQKQIESQVSSYYKNSSTTVQRGNMTLFEFGNAQDYQPIAIGGLVGQMVSGNLQHSYSKVNVRNSTALYAGGVIGMVPYAPNIKQNYIDLYEVFAFGDVFASIAENVVSGAGGILGYVNFSRTLNFTKVNAVNYWSLTLDTKTNTYYLPSNIYDIYAVTGNTNAYTNIAPITLNNLVVDNSGAISIKAEYLNLYNLPTIACAVNSDSMFAVKNIDFDLNGANSTSKTNNAYASLGSSSFYKMINEDTQSITSFYTFTSTQVSGSEMDTYFRNSDWDPNYWYRYQNNMLPSLITYSENHIYYIYVAQDLKNMVAYPDATFIVVGQNNNGIVKVGNYIRNTGLNIDNFSGVLKGYDSTGDYGFDFEGYSLTFISSTTAGAKIYNLSIKNLGSASSMYQENFGSFVDQSIQTTYENLTFSNCQLYSSASSATTSIGLMANSITGGYISNITFVDCSVNAKANANITNLNVGLMAGQITTQSNSYVQIYDVTAYLSNGNINNSILNDINVDVNGKTIINLCVGTVAGKTTGSVMLYYTANSNTETRIKGVGVSGTSSNPYSADSSFSSIYKGIVFDVQDNNLSQNGAIINYNAGLVIGETNSLNLSFQRSSATQKLNIVGGLTNSGNVDITNANLGGAIGKVANSISISNSASFVDKYVNVDCDINFSAQKVNAGMLIGTSGTVYTIDNIDTYGTINVKATEGASNIGGFVGKANADINISNAVSRTKITVDDDNNSSSALTTVGGLVGLFNSTTSKMVIGENNFNTKYLGTIIISTNNVYAGGILGSALSTSSAVNNDNGIRITSAVFGGDIIIESTALSYIGGIMGASNYNGLTNNEPKRLLKNNLAYGNIYVNCDLAENEDASYVGGLLGKGSSFTYLNSNYSVATIFTAGTQTHENANINALVGVSNGSKTDTDTNNQKYVNYYSNQVSLCLDYNPSESVDAFASENVYYLTNNGTGTSTMLDVLTAYKNQLTELEKTYEIYYGSKINPILINESGYSTASGYFNDDFGGKAKYFVINQALSENKMQNITLKNAFIIGDGFTLTNKNNAVFAEIDAKSVVSGIKVKAEITTSNTNFFSGGTVSATGVGTLANVNKGTIYACNTNEVQSASIYDVYGIKNTNSGVYVGGLVGVNGGYILDSYADVDVKGSSNAGGLVGLNAGLISNSYSTGKVVSPTAYAFGQGNGGKVYYCYTSSMVEGSSASVFGNNTAIGCYYDLYGTGVWQNIQNGDENTIITSNTNTMAVITENTGTEIFLSNPTASIKFGYDFTKNYGYLTFNGEAYSNFSYMQNGSTGNGSVSNNAILIPNVGKLQQLNDNATQAKHYALINDISLTSDMASRGADDYGIKNWKAIGISEGSAFAGTLTGEYFVNEESNNHSISGLASTTLTGYVYGSIFGETNNAEITNLTIKDSSFENQTDYIAGLVSRANNTTIENITVENCTFNYTASGGINLGGIVAKATGLTTIENCSVSQSTTFGYGQENSSSSYTSNIGGLVGSALNSVSIKNSTVGNACQFGYISSGSVKLGAILGSADGSQPINNQPISIEDCSVGNEIVFSYSPEQSVSSKSNIGGIVGYSKGLDITNVEMGATNQFNYLANGTSYMGGAVGFADQNTSLDTVKCGEGYAFKYTATTGANSSYMGGMFGKASNVLITSSSIANAYSFEYSSNGTSYMGALAGIIDAGQASSVNLSGITYGTNYDFSFATTLAGTNTNYLGGLAGKIDGATITNSSTQTISGSSWNYKYTLSDSFSIQNYVGGVAGYIDNSTISGFSVENVNFGGSISSASLGENYLGGVAGYIANSTIKTIKVLSCTNLCSYSGYVGGIAGVVENTEIGKEFTGGTANITLSNLNIDGVETAKIGGVAGKINNISEEEKNIQNISISSCHINNPSLSAKVGGVVGESDSATLSIKYVDIDGSSTITSNNTAGGILGEGSIDTIYKCNNNASVSAYAQSLEISGGENDDTITPYAGGIVGKLVAGIISECDNTGLINAGYNVPNAKWFKYNFTDMIIGENIEYSKGSNQSFAGGISGYSGAEVVVLDSRNFNSVTAKAKITVAIKKANYSFEVFGVGYRAEGYLGGKVEKAYANGISYISNGTSLLNCSNSGSIIGGDSTYWNMFHSNYDDSFYVIDYGYQYNSSSADVYASWVAYDDDAYSGGILGGARSVWENDFGLYMVSNSYYGSNDINIIIYDVCYPSIENLYYANQICNNPIVSTNNMSGNFGYILNCQSLVSYPTYNNVSGCTSYALNYPISMLGSLNAILENSISVLRNQSTESNPQTDVNTSVGNLPTNYIHNDGGLGIA
ncbi:MAG: hypothetical protein PHQ62_02965 [Clostridia bacterium]|nr:hypothetical protein [Clostridia bacterium]